MHRTRLRCATAVCQNSFFCAFEAIFTAPFFLPDVATACASAGSVARMTLHDPTPPALECQGPPDQIRFGTPVEIRSRRLTAPPASLSRPIRSRAQKGSRA